MAIIKRRRGLLFGILVAVSLFIGMGLWYVQDRWGTNGFAMKQETPGWAAVKDPRLLDTELRHTYLIDVPPENRPGIFLRYVSDESKILLLRYNFAEGVYIVAAELDVSSPLKAKLFTTDQPVNSGKPVVFGVALFKWGNAR
jgi:hypothetical protein